MSYSFTSPERDVFKDLLTDRFGLAFEEHRHHILDSALGRRMRDCGIDSAVAYRQLVESDDGELGRLVDAVTNNLSRFFRNRDQLRAITDIIVPELDLSRAVSVWVAGCATGEEPYSLAMTLADSLPKSTGFHITATDISRRALEFARSATYSPTRIRAIPGSILDRYFVGGDGRLQISASLRRRVSFVEHNVMEAPPLREADLVLCRNVLTYLAPSARRLVIRRLRESLSDGGFLIIGNSETLPRGSGFNSIATPRARVYRRPCRPSKRSLP